RGRCDTRRARHLAPRSIVPFAYRAGGDERARNGARRMTMHRFLPHRWRTRREAADHAEAIADVLDTAPIVPRSDGLVLFSMIGTAVLLPYLVAVKSLWSELRRGRI